MTSIPEIFAKQKRYYNSGATRSYASRAEALERLKSSIEEYEEEIHRALYSDLRKGPLESYVAEVHFVLSEIDYFLKRLKKFMKKRPACSGLIN